jgi:RHS repeat-associated protein
MRQSPLISAAERSLFPGQYTDTESGLQYLRARYYDPTTSAFLTRDPIEAQTQNPYGYVNGNPLNLTDPLTTFLVEARLWCHRRCNGRRWRFNRCCWRLHRSFTSGRGRGHGLGCHLDDLVSGTGGGNLHGWQSDERLCPGFSPGHRFGHHYGRGLWSRAVWQGRSGLGPRRPLWILRWRSRPHWP